MNILVFGAGAVGSYLGARLAKAGHAVTLVVRPATAEILKTSGLTVTEENDRVVVQPDVVSSLRQAFLDEAAYDLILLGMKSYDVDIALNELVAFCPSPPPLITLQNGIGIEEKFIEQFGAERVIAGSLTVPLSLESSQSIVVERTDRGLGLAPTQPRQSIGRWVEMFREAGVDTMGVADFRSMKWSKAMLNMVGNASSAILNRHPKVIYSSNLTFNIEMKMLQETLAVMRKLKLKVVDLPGSPAARLASAISWLPGFVIKPFMTKIVADGRGGKMPSFHIDLAAGKENNEVRYHNGAVAQIGRAQRVATPVNTALSDILLKLARKEANWRDYEGNPKRLAYEVKKYRQMK